MFAHRLPLAEAYVALLAGPGTVRGLIGPREAPRLWERHVLSCALVADLLPEGSSVADLGSGAGLPGLVLALRRPDLRVTLVEPLLRRTTFLEEVVADLGLDTVEVVRDRAEALHGHRSFDVVTSRALAPLDRLLAWSLPLAREGGHLVAMKGRSAQEELDACADVLRDLGGRSPEVLRREFEGVSEPTTVVRVEAGPPPDLPWGRPRPAPTARARKGRSRPR